MNEAVKEYWEPDRLKDYGLTVLVTDIRKSTKTLRRANLTKIIMFMRAFGGMTFDALQFPKNEYQINNFIGDGFLIFFREINPFALEQDKIGPERAVTTALRMREEFRALCKRPEITEKGFKNMKLSAGIAFGSVIYGPLIGPIPQPDSTADSDASFIQSPRYTGITHDVTLAFRLSKEDGSGQILISEEAHQRLPPGCFRTQALRRDLKGLGTVTCYKVLGPAKPSKKPTGKGIKARPKKP